MLGITVGTQQGLIDAGVPVRVLSAVDIQLFMDTYSARLANSALDNGEVVIFACGSGLPFFSTDTAAALRAAQIHADALLLTKNIDGVYSADPKKDPFQPGLAPLSLPGMFHGHVQQLVPPLLNTKTFKKSSR